MVGRGGPLRRSPRAFRDGDSGRSPRAFRDGDRGRSPRAFHVGDRGRSPRAFHVGDRGRSAGVPRWRSRAGPTGAPHWRCPGRSRLSIPIANRYWPSPLSIPPANPRLPIPDCRSPTANLHCQSPAANPAGHPHCRSHSGDSRTSGVRHEPLGGSRPFRGANRQAAGFQRYPMRPRGAGPRQRNTHGEQIRPRRRFCLVRRGRADDLRRGPGHLGLPRITGAVVARLLAWRQSGPMAHRGDARSRACDRLIGPRGLAATQQTGGRTLVKHGQGDGRDRESNQDFQKSKPVLAPARPNRRPPCPRRRVAHQDRTGDRSVRLTAPRRRRPGRSASRPGSDVAGRPPRLAATRPRNSRLARKG